MLWHTSLTCMDLCVCVCTTVCGCAYVCVCICEAPSMHAQWLIDMPYVGMCFQYGHQQKDKKKVQNHHDMAMELDCTAAASGPRSPKQPSPPPLLFRGPCTYCVGCKFVYQRMNVFLSVILLRTTRFLLKERSRDLAFRLGYLVSLYSVWDDLCPCIPSRIVIQARVG